MALHGMARITIGVPQLEGVRQFYRDFGLSEGEAGDSRPGTAASSCGWSTDRSASSSSWWSPRMTATTCPGSRERPPGRMWR